VEGAVAWLGWILGVSANASNLIRYVRVTMRNIEFVVKPNHRSLELGEQIILVCQVARVSLQFLCSPDEHHVGSIPTE